MSFGAVKQKYVIPVVFEDKLTAASKIKTVASDGLDITWSLA